jgi:hypothetical protein
MADDRYDQLLQIRQQAAHNRLVSGLENQRQANLADYWQAINENDVNAAAFAQSEYHRNTRELAEMTGAQAAQQQQQAQPQQGQQQFTQAEQEWIRGHENVVRDPKKWNECLAAANSLIARGYDRDSPQYLAAIELALGLTGADGRDGVEVASPDVALEAINNSQIARRYGAVTPQEYNHYRQHLDALKRAGLRQMDDTP